MGILHTEPIKIRRALLSVSDKRGIVELAQGLSNLGVELISTGGTARTISEAGIPVKPVSELTGFPEMMEGRVKTLHPLIHGGILGLRDVHSNDAGAHQIPWIDLVVCNLYPFEQTIERKEVSLDEAMEQIDIGGPTMIRSAAKNVGWVLSVTSPEDYAPLVDELKTLGSVSFTTRRRLSAKAFSHTAAYDTVIQRYLTEEKYPEEVTLTFRRHSFLRYGENPHQEAGAYREILPPDHRPGMSVLDAEVLNGKELSFNNIQDAAGALQALREFDRPASVVVKHASPCGAAEGDDITNAVKKAFEADQLSAFGGIVSMNRTCTADLARYFSKIFFEIMIAPDYEPEALEILKKKKQLRILKTGPIVPRGAELAPKMIPGGMLLQQGDNSVLTADMLKPVTTRIPTDAQVSDMLFAWKVLKHVKSNGILTACEGTTLGIGGGQVSRVDAVKIALDKSSAREGTVLASDAFFPFRDSIDEIAQSGITAVIQPGGSVRDEEVIDACNEHGIAMVFTGMRCFFHG